MEEEKTETVNIKEIGKINFIWKSGNSRTYIFPKGTKIKIDECGFCAFLDKEFVHSCYEKSKILKYSFDDFSCFDTKKPTCAISFLNQYGSQKVTLSPCSVMSIRDKITGEKETIFSGSSVKIFLEEGLVRNKATNPEDAIWESDLTSIKNPEIVNYTSLYGFVENFGDNFVEVNFGIPKSKESLFDTIVERAMIEAKFQNFITGNHDVPSIRNVEGTIFVSVPDYIEKSTGKVVFKEVSYKKLTDFQKRTVYFCCHEIFSDLDDIPPYERFLDELLENSKFPEHYEGFLAFISKKLEINGRISEDIHGVISNRSLDLDTILKSKDSSEKTSDFFINNIVPELNRIIDEEFSRESEENDEG